MNNKFFTGKGRFGGFTNSRYMSATYGRNSFIEPEPELQADQAHGTYGALLFDKRWSAKRAEIIARDDGRCVVCKSNVSLQVHHRQYHYIKGLKRFKPPWDYENYLLVTLCEKCHSKGHNRFRVPNVYI